MPERSRLRTGENQDGRSVSPATVTRSVAVLYMAIGAIAFVVLFLRGPLAQDPFIVFTRGTPRSELFVGHRAFVTLGTLLYLGYFLWLVSVVLDERFPSVLQLGLLPIVVGPFLLLGRRETVISICLIVVVFCYYTRAFRITETTSAVPRLLSRLPRSVYPLVVVGAAASLAVSIPVLRALRLGRSVSDGLADIDAISMLTFGIHNDEIDYFLALREVVPAEIGFYYGTHYLRVFTTPIPRAVWENKPVITAGGLLRRLVMPEASGGRPPGFLGNYYLNFGEFGFLLGGVLFGAILAVVYVLLTRETTGAFGIMLFSIVLPAIGRNGLINNFLAPLLVDLSAVLVALIAVFLISGGHGAPGTSVGSHTLARRNRRAMLAAVGVLAFTVAGSGGTVSLLGRQAREERETIHRRAARRAFELEARGELRDNLDVAELRIEARRGASTVAGTIRNPSDSFTFPASIALRSMDGDDPEYGWIELGDISPQSTVEFARRLDVPVHRPENLAYVVTQWTI